MGDWISIAEGAAAVVAVGAGVAAAYGRWRKQSTRVKVTITPKEQIEDGLRIQVVNDSAFEVKVHQIQVLHWKGRLSRRMPADVSHLADPRPPKTVSANRGEFTFFLPNTAVTASRPRLAAKYEKRNEPIQVRIRIRDKQWVRSNRCLIQS